MSQKEKLTLRCVWVPTHIGGNASLAAVWIQMPGHPATVPSNAACTSEEGDWWACAA